MSKYVDWASSLVHELNLDLNLSLLTGPKVYILKLHKVVIQ